MSLNCVRSLAERDVTAARRCSETIARRRILVCRRLYGERNLAATYMLTLLPTVCQPDRHVVNDGGKYVVHHSMDNMRYYRRWLPKSSFPRKFLRMGF